MNAPLATPFSKTFGGSSDPRQLVTAVNQLIDANNALSTVGPQLTASATIILTASIHHVTGTAAIKYITPLKQAIGPAYLIADAAWSLVTGGNIGFALTATPGQHVKLLYDGATWYP